MKFIPVLRPILPDVARLVPYLRRIDASRRYSNNGPLCEEFEEQLCGALSLPKGCMAGAASGTAALVGVIFSRAGRGTRRRPLAVIPSFTFSATACAVQECGYDVFLADVDPDSWALDATHVAKLPELDRAGVVAPGPRAFWPERCRKGPWLDFQRHTGIPVVIDGAALFGRAFAVVRRRALEKFLLF